MTYLFDEEFAESAARTRSPRPGPAARAWIWGLAASAVFLATALALTITGYAYGALLGIAPEYPLMLSTPFVVAALLVVADDLPITGVAGAAWARTRGFSRRFLSWPVSM
ncbi:MAG: hypothetical protein AABZ63_01155 [Actinomycetota bacterium]